MAGYEKAIQSAFRDVSDALSARHWLRRCCATVAAQGERARLAQLRYDHGASPYLEVLDAQRDLLAAQQKLVQTAAGRVALGQDAHHPGRRAAVRHSAVLFVASTAQFTPKTVETASERQKLDVPREGPDQSELLHKHLQQVKTGLPGVAWIKLDAGAQWPAQFEVRVP